MQIKITKTQSPKEKPTGALGFGQIFTDHMFLMNYTEGKGWHDARIEPFAEMAFSPASLIFHYGQETFEGLKAYKGKNGECYLFRPEMNARRNNASNVRMCIPEIPEEDYVNAVKALVRLDADWIPEGADSSLYIRPFFIATDPFLGIAVSKTYLFMIIMCPCDAFFGTLEPVGIRVEDEFVRAVRGGTGLAKTGGNYAASLAALKRARAEGYSQAMWLDGVERKYIEEVGTMNIFFKIAGRIHTPALNGSILHGITRDSVIALCKAMGFEVEERAIEIEEIAAAAADGTLEEIFGTGTAVVISPVNRLLYRGKELTAGDGNVGALSNKLYETLGAIQRGDAPDPHGWRVKI